MTLQITAALHETRDIDAAIDRACTRIAPNWPLDQLIAVNPLWGWVDEPFGRMTARLQALLGSRLLMPRAWYREQFRSGRFGERHVRAAIGAGSEYTVEAVLAALADVEPDDPPRRALVTDCADGMRTRRLPMSWPDFVTQAISQYCAAYFDDGQADVRPDRSAGLYRTWRRHAGRDFSPRLLAGLRGFRVRARALPEDPRAVIRQGVGALRIPAHEIENYLTALLLSINGWAACCAYQTWQAQLEGRCDEHLIELLAIRLAWDWLLFELHDPPLDGAWNDAIAQWSVCDARAAAALAVDLLLQHAIEIAYQDEIAAQLLAGRDREHAQPDTQAVFCIDVRSEVFRRALEATDDGIESRGFAGFFGVPGEYRPLAAASSRPQLPGLFAPRLRLADTGGDAALAKRRTGRLQLASVWKRFRASPPTMFPFVETGGLLYGAKLLAGSFGWSKTANADRAGLSAAERRRLKPRLVSHVDGTAVSEAQRADLAAQVLRAMSLTTGFARLLVLVGHGSASTNNPLSGALECGACGGHSGEVNARAMAALLNDPAVRRGLAERGIVLPQSTLVLAGLHNTATDEVTLFDLDEVPDSHRDDVVRLRARLARAGERCRSERATGLPGASKRSADLRAALARRTRDWSQLRPEWGLVNSAAFIIAPRASCRHVDFAGRAFLHDYCWQDDPDLGVLTLILTAPMVVTHWINLQYYASTVDNRRFGSGNKVLHNVVGGHLGVFEGNGGDLRIGLPLQSLHDGERWRHEPLRLSVFVDAPESAIDSVLGKHPQIAGLVDNAWLHLFRFDASAGAISRRRGAGSWVPCGPATQ